MTPRLIRCLLAVCAICLSAVVHADEEKLTIAVIPKGTTHVFWKSIHAGAAKAGQELGVEIIWQGPEREDDRSQQIQLVTNMTNRKVSAIVLAPLDEKALARPVTVAAKRKIPVVIIDSDVQGENHVSFVATDNFVGGKLAGQRLAEVLGGKGRVLMMRYSPGSASTAKREAGFLEGIKEFGPDIELVSTDQYGGVTAAEAMKVAENLLNKYNDIDGIFTPNESTTFGMLRALDTAGRAGKIKFVGFDASAPLITGLEKGQIHGLAVQNPFNMGYLGVKTAVAAVRGEAVEARVDTGVQMVTPENLQEPAIQELINPDIAKWLGE
jgi:ribose transport system substrate-binding protein